MSTSVLAPVLAAVLTAVLTTMPGQAVAQNVKVVSDKTISGFKYPESVAYDPDGKALYVSQFGSELKPMQKDGKGYISKVDLEGNIIEEMFLPVAGQTLDKPKGIWVAGNRLWVTDIDSVWVFDIQTKEGRQVELPGIDFANDVTISENVLYVSDNRGDQLFSVEPADFLNDDPKISLVFSGRSINPNGVYPAADGSLLMVGFAAAESPRGIYSMKAGGNPKELAAGLGRLDGLYEMEGGDLLVTDWNSGALSIWNAKLGLQKLAGDFKGPADFGVVPNAQGLLVAVPDLVKSELRMIQLSN